MRHINIPGTELNPSALCLGVGAFGAGRSEPESYGQMDYFFERGGNFLDTARIYSDWIPGEKSRSERIVGDYLNQRRTRDKWVIGTKGAHPELETMHISRLDRKNLRIDVEGSLKSLRTDYIDLYYLHRDNTELGVGEIIDWLNEFAADGKIRYFGCSNWKTKRIREAQEYAKANGKMGFCANQPLWNVGCYTMAPGPDATLVTMNKEMLLLHREMNMAVSPYSSQAGGFFSKLDSPDKSVRQAALKSGYASKTNLALFKVIKGLSQKYGVPVSHIVLAYLCCQPSPTIPVFSSTSIKQLDDTIRGAAVELSKDDIELLDSLNGSGLTGNKP
jgi:aryl-alcohol dehydrogenase-like predicted oxidoreductase